MKQLLKPYLNHNIFLLTGLLILSIACTPIERMPRRSMTVNIGPERVFERPVVEILPELENAIASGSNGRVGNELVFWSYTLADNSRVNLFACAILDDVNCESRLSAICPAGGEELTRTNTMGLIRQLNCRVIGIANVGDILPNCVDRETSNELLVGLMQCR